MPKMPFRKGRPVLTPRVKKGAWQKQIQANTNRLNKKARGMRTSHRGR
jgi:hypothetical protein